MNVVVTAPADTTVENLVNRLAEGTAFLHKERETGTFRRVHFLAEGTKAREEAEWVQNARDEGRTMRDIANELHLSVAAVRRMLNDLRLTEELEDSEAEELEALLAGAYDMDAINA